MTMDTLTLDQANFALRQGLADLKKITTIKEMEGLVESLNDILYNAIANYPTQVNAVEVSVTLSPDVEEKGFRMAGSILSGRYVLKNALPYLLAFSSEGHDPISWRLKQESIDFKFVKHLPYSFTTGTHGSGERMARNGSFEALSFSLSYDKNEVPSFLEIDLEDRSLSLNKARLALPEINEICLTQVNNRDFTPALMPKSNHFCRENSHTAEQHYFAFKAGSCFYGIDAKAVPEKVMNSIKDFYREVAVPDIETGLLELGYPMIGSGHTDITGFAMDISRSAPVMYEFDHVALPSSLKRSDMFGLQQVVAAYLISQHTADPQRNIQTYRGKEIIDRLVQIEPRRQF